MATTSSTPTKAWTVTRVTTVDVQDSLTLVGRTHRAEDIPPREDGSLTTPLRCPASTPRRTHVLLDRRPQIRVLLPDFSPVSV